MQKLSPTQAIPEEARWFSIRGQTWIKDAKNPSDFEEASKEFDRALWVARGEILVPPIQCKGR